MIFKRQFGMICIFLLAGIIYSTAIFADSEIDKTKKVEVTGEQGIVHLTPTQATAIDLRVEKVEFRPLVESLILNGEAQLLPNHQADVSTRISGQITAIYANLGEVVKVNQPLVKVQSRLVGDPPPSVVIKAPMDGVIDTRNVNLGQSVEPNTVLFHISNRTQVIVVARVYEEDLNKIQLGQETMVNFVSYPKQSFPGKVSLIEPNLDPITRTVKIWVTLDNLQDLIKPNMFARVTLLFRKRAAVLTVPTTAIIEANHEKFVFVRKSENYHRVIVATGTSDENNTEITRSDLAPGDEVVTQGNRQLYTLWLTGGRMQPEV